MNDCELAFIQINIQIKFVEISTKYDNKNKNPLIQLITSKN